MNPAQYTGLKDPCPATRSVAAHTSASASAPTAQPAVGLRQPGANPSGWSDGLLELFLRHVDRADLASCRSVCRSWHEAGASDSLQLDCFLNGWQPRALQPLLQAAARQLPPTASLVEVRRCLYRLIQERLQAPRFSARHLTVVEEPSMSESVDELRFSPDGQFAAMSFYGTGGWADELQYCCSLYSMRAGQFHREYHCVQNLPLQGLLFGADSRSLQAVDTSGQLHEWQCCSDGHWQAREPVPLGPPAAHRCWPARMAAGLRWWTLAQIRATVVSIFISRLCSCSTRRTAATGQRPGSGVVRAPSCVPAAVSWPTCVSVTTAGFLCLPQPRMCLSASVA